MIKLVANKNYIADILEEIIEYNVEEDQVFSYVSIVEQAQNDLSILLRKWNMKKKGDDMHECYSEEKLTYFGLKAVEAVAYLHSINVYYGDMKPQNLLIFRDMSVKLGDFGISIKLSEEAADEEEYEIKGVTKGYSSKQIIKKYDAGMVTRGDLLQNDYYGLYKTCKLLLQQYKEQVNPNGLFASLVKDLKILKGIKVKGKENKGGL